MLIYAIQRIKSIENKGRLGLATIPTISYVAHYRVLLFEMKLLVTGYGSYKGYKCLPSNIYHLVCSHLDTKVIWFQSNWLQKLQRLQCQPEQQQKHNY